MALLSKNFKSDVVGKTYSITPIIILADYEISQYKVIDAFSTNTLSLKDNNNNLIQTKGIINKISSIKNSVDYENRKLKINTFRFTLFNYHDPKTKLSDSESYSISTTNALPTKSFIGKYVILFYKTQRTNELNLDTGLTQLNDNQCPIIFSGIINRAEQTGDQIKIQAEDSTQIKIANKQVPRHDLSNLPPNFNSIDLGGVVMEDNETFPMVFNAVDKAPAVTVAGDDGTYWIHDSRPIHSKFTTSPIDNVNYMVAGQDIIDDSEQGYTTEKYRGITWFNVKDGDSYAKWKPAAFGSGTLSFEADLGYSYTDQKYGDAFSSSVIDGPVLTELHDLPNLSHYAIGFSFPKRALIKGGGLTWWSELTGEAEGELLGVKKLKDLEWSLDGSSTQLNLLNGNLGGVNLNSFMQINNKPIGQFYRAGERNFSGDRNLFDGLGLYGGGYLANEFDINTNEEGQGHLIIWEFDKSQKFIQLLCNTAGVGNAWNLDGGNYDANNDSNDYKFWIMPLDVEYWKEVEDGTTLDEILAANSHDVYIKCPNGNSPDEHDSFYSATSVMPEFLGIEDNPFNEVQTNKLLAFDYFQPEFVTDEDTYSRGWWVGRQMATYFKQITDPLKEKMFCEIYGRKDFAYTEENFGIDPSEKPLMVQIQGPDGALPDFTTLVQSVDDKLRDMVEYLYTEPITIGPTTYPAWCDYGNGHIGQMPHRGVNTGEGLYEIMNQVDTYTALGTFVDAWKTEWFALDDSEIWQQEATMRLVVHIYSAMAFSPPVYGEASGASGLRAWNSMFWFGSPPEEFSPSGLSWDNYSNHADHTSLRRAVVRRCLKYLYLNDLNENVNSDSYLATIMPTEYQLNFEWDSFDINTNSVVGFEHLLANMEGYFDDLIGNWYVWFMTQDNSGETIFYQDMHFEADAESFWTQITDPLALSLDTVVPNLTNGVIQTPTDIVLNILGREMLYGSYQNGDLLDPAFFDNDSISESRNEHSSFTMGFCINEKTDGKKLIEKILDESKSYPVFTPEGKFGFITIKREYSDTDINHTINPNDVFSHKVTRTKREDVFTSSKYSYRYDNGQNNYIMETPLLDIKSLYPAYEGLKYYNIDENDGYKQKELRHHTHKNTAEEFQNFELLNNCNQHLIIEFEVGLNHAIKLGDIIHFSGLIDGKAFGIDYTKIQQLNQQIIYPLFIAMETNISSNSLKVKAYQLHFLKDYTHTDHGFNLAGPPNVIWANLREFNSTYVATDGSPMPNWNYLPPSQYIEGNIYLHDGVEIPYGDPTGDGIISIDDLINIIVWSNGAGWLNLGEQYGTFSEEAKQRLGNINYNTGQIVEGYYDWDNPNFNLGMVWYDFYVANGNPV